METTTSYDRDAPLAGASRYPPIGDYALIGDCRTAALVSADGSIDWLCLPHFSAPALFAALLDRRRGGCFSVRPVGAYRVTRHYVGGTPVLRTVFRTDRGVWTLTDLMPINADERIAKELLPQRELLRCIAVIEGEAEIEVRYAPRPNFARSRTRLHSRGAFGWACRHRDGLCLLHSDIALALSEDERELHARLHLRQGQRRYFSLTCECAGIGVAAPLAAAAEERLARTLAWWRDWADRCAYRGPHRAAVVRSVLTLKLLTYELSGAVVAAPTTSLPEAIGGVRNWDYRYCWLRDASLTLLAFMDLGFTTEGDAFLGWLLHTTRLSHPRLQVLYDVYGETRLPERTLDHFEGYRGSRPVRIGNGASRQLQLDTYGSVVLAASDFAERGGTLDDGERYFLRGLGEAVCRVWREPDHGIWEIRGAPRHHTYSKLMCWVALDRLVLLHERYGVSMPVERFKRERDAIAGAIEAGGFNEELQAYTAYFGAAVPDASLLLMTRYGFRKPDDVRMRATFDCIERMLARGDLLYRYPPGDDNLPAREGAFLIASFWCVDYLVAAGRVGEAEERFERLLRYANDLGLYSEEVDPQNGAALGNFPQAFSHVGLITAALSLAAARERQEAA